MTEHEPFTTRQALLLALLRCPQCQGGLELRDPTSLRGAVLAGDLWCSDHGRVGVVDNFKPCFLQHDLDSVAPGTMPSTVRHHVVPETADPSTTWRNVDLGLMSSTLADGTLTINPKGETVRLRFWVQRWCGILRIEFGNSVEELDLYSESDGDWRWIEVAVPPGDQVTLFATGRKRDAALASDVLLAEVVDLVPLELASLPSVEREIRGLGYTEHFTERLAGLDDDAVALDCGGGDQRHGDHRLINLEYLPFPCADVSGDSLQLPFDDGTFDLMLSQAVLEHVSDPQRAFDEMIRVLKPGGELVITIAFTQPLHAVPFHYFNVTPHGLDHLTRDVEVVDKGVFGGLHDYVEWVCRILAAEHRIGADRRDALLETLKELDGHTTPKELESHALAVWAIVKKPGG